MLKPRLGSLLQLPPDGHRQFILPDGADGVPSGNAVSSALPDLGQISVRTFAVLAVSRFGFLAPFSEILARPFRLTLSRFQLDL